MPQKRRSVPAPSYGEGCLAVRPAHPHSKNDGSVNLLRSSVTGLYQYRGLPFPSETNRGRAAVRLTTALTSAASFSSAGELPLLSTSVATLLVQRFAMPLKVSAVGRLLQQPFVLRYRSPGISCGARGSVPHTAYPRRPRNCSSASSHLRWLSRGIVGLWGRKGCLCVAVRNACLVPPSTT